ncbi:MAG: NUDIX domain-containing protein [Candidatus Magasanikbacteria bacterium]|nr:NUDIX domain-containing protein [Candidatus Magasanikbacteria bacterium]
MNKENKVYFGVYGIYIKNESVLMINKARGPYTGQYDLPGGKLEFFETIEECLTREILEETNSVIEKMQFLGHNEYQCRYIKDGEERDFHHVGLYYLVELDTSNLKIDPDGQDSLGAKFVLKSDITVVNTSPISYPLIQKAFSAPL